MKNYTEIDYLKRIESHLKTIKQWAMFFGFTSLTALILLGIYLFGIWADSQYV